MVVAIYVVSQFKDLKMFQCCFQDRNCYSYLREHAFQLYLPLPKRPQLRLKAHGYLLKVLFDSNQLVVIVENKSSSVDRETHKTRFDAAVSDALAAA